MNASATRIGAAVIALALIATGLFLDMPWLALMAVLVAIVAVALTR